MAHLHRLIVFACALLLSAASFGLPPQTQYRVNFSNGGTYASPWAGTRLAACAAFASSAPTSPFTPSSCTGLTLSVSSVTTETSACTVYRTMTCDGKASGGDTATHRYAYGYLNQTSCPANSTADGNSCVCSAGYEEKDGQCRKINPCPNPDEIEMGGACVPKACKEGEIRVNGFCVPDPDRCPDGKQKVDGKCPEPKCERDMPWVVTLTASMPSAICEVGCVYMISSAMACSDAGAGNPANCGVTYFSNGASCNQPPEKPGKEPGSGGGSGGGGGGSGGGGGGGSGGGGGGTGGGGGGGGKGPSNNNNNIPGVDPGADGKCPPEHYRSGGKCYPNKPDTKDPEGGGSGGTGTCPDKYSMAGGRCVANQPPPDDLNDDFCKENPELTSCKPSSFTGSCQANFACEGDAVQCAMAREQHQRNCQLYGGDDDTESPFNRAVSGRDDKDAEALKRDATQVSVGQLDQAGLGWSRACPADPSFEVVGKTFSIPFSRVCPVLSVLAYAALGLTLLSCLLWVVGKKD